MKSIQTVIWHNLSPIQKKAALARPRLEMSSERSQQVAEILRQVRDRGDAAVREYTRRFDGVDLEQLQVPPAQIAQALAGLEPALRRAIERAKDRIACFHQAQWPQPLRVETAPSVVCEAVYRPIQRVGLYVPAGTAPLPSTVLMLAVPAAIAGCPHRVLVTPPVNGNGADPVVLATAALCGVDAVYLAGGAQAIAALAYGTESVPKVDKIYGPGNAWVTEAKQQVAADPSGAGIDMPAGPSEVLVVADGSVPAVFTACDLLSQAEHGPDSQVVLVTDNPALLAEVKAHLEQRVDELSRASTARQSLQHARLILVPDEAGMLAVSNAYAPEHLIVQLENPRPFVEGITAAGSVFVGPWTPESLGDYCSGTNHVLPTYGHARHQSGLSLADFLTRITVQEASADGLRAIGPDAEKLATAEGLDAHRLAVSRRLRWLSDNPEPESLSPKRKTQQPVNTP